MINLMVESSKKKKNVMVIYASCNASFVHYTNSIRHKYIRTQIIRNYILTEMANAVRSLQVNNI